MLVWKQKFITFLVFVVGLLVPIAANSQETSSEESVIDFGSMTSFDAVYFKPPNHDYEVSIEIYLHDKKFFYVPYFFIDLQDLEAAKIVRRQSIWASKEALIKGVSGSSVCLIMLLFYDEASGVVQMSVV